MKYDSIQTKIKILIISVLIVGLIIYICFVDKSLKWGIEKIISCIIISVYGFFIAPTIKYVINWFKTASIEESFYAGLKIGYYGIGLLVLLDPIIGIMYYFNKHFTKSSGTRNIVMVGWYIV